MSKNRDKKKREQKKYLERVRRQKGKKSATPHRAELIASLPPNTRIVDAIPGLPKMSEQMMAFIDPYASEADSFESRRWLLMVGQAAWNIALRPPEERATMVADLVKTFQANGSEHAPTLLAIIAALVHRKETEPRFARDKRVIASFVLSDLPDEWHLQVASILPP
jgi:hypothetical protein